MKQALLENIFMIIVDVAYFIYIGRHYYNFKQNAGAKINTYNHRSGIKITGYVMIVLGLFYAYMFAIQPVKQQKDYITAVLFLLFVILVTIVSTRNIHVYENGFTYAGKYVPYDRILDVSRLRKGIQISLVKKGLSDMLYMGNVEKDNELMAFLRKKAKITRKSSKKK